MSHCNTEATSEPIRFQFMSKTYW